MAMKNAGTNEATAKLVIVRQKPNPCTRPYIHSASTSAHNPSAAKIALRAIASDGSLASPDKASAKKTTRQIGTPIANGASPQASAARIVAIDARPPNNAPAHLRKQAD